MNDQQDPPPFFRAARSVLPDCFPEGAPFWRGRSTCSPRSRAQLTDSWHIVDRFVVITAKHSLSSGGSRHPGGRMAEAGMACLIGDRGLVLYVQILSHRVELHSANSVKRKPGQLSAARISAPNISLSTGFSPKAHDL